jgi:hypothetical protein
MEIEPNEIDISDPKYGDQHVQHPTEAQEENEFGYEVIQSLSNSSFDVIQVLSNGSYDLSMSVFY